MISASGLAIINGAAVFFFCGTVGLAHLTEHPEEMEPLPPERGSGKGGEVHGLVAIKLQWSRICEMEPHDFTASNRQREEDNQ